MALAFLIGFTWKSRKEFPQGEKTKSQIKGLLSVSHSMNKKCIYALYNLMSVEVSNHWTLMVTGL